MPVSGLDKSLGALLVGTWANSFLFMLEILQILRYFRHYKNDNNYYKGLVVLVLCIDALSTIGNYACVYLYTITHWGNMAYLINQYWPIPVYLTTTGASAAVVQTFLITRFYKLSKNIIISIVLLLVTLSAFGGSIATAIIIIKFPLYHERSQVRVPVTVWLICSAVADVAIAVSLILQLNRMKTSFKTTQSMIKRLSIGAVTTGAPGSLVATIALCVYLSDPDENVSVGLAFCLGRIYALTMLMNLNTRNEVRDESSKSGYTDKDDSNPQTHAHVMQNQTFINGIHVHRSAVVRIDESAKNDDNDGSFHELSDIKALDQV